MHSLVSLCVVAAVFAAASAASAAYYYPVNTVSRPQIVAGLSALPTADINILQSLQTQYQTQDNFGQYSYGYSEPLSAKHEFRTSDGVTRGAYSYIDANRKLQTVEYVADDKGFHVSATNLPHANLRAPEPVTETPEVAAARAQHLAAHHQLQQTDSSAGALLKSSALLSVPQPVQDTPEVAAAKLEFFKLYEQERARHQTKGSLQKETTIYSAPITVRNPSNFAIGVPSTVVPGLRYHYAYPILIAKPQSAYLPLARY